jgi:hypothetical protein
MISPYAGKPDPSWLSITRRLVAKHPLKAEVLRAAALAAWKSLWQTTVGSGQASVGLSQFRVPSTVVGYFFEVLLAQYLQRRAPDLWRGNQSKEEKDKPAF